MIVWKAHAGLVYDLAFTPDGRQLATSGRDRTVRLWDVMRQAEVRRWDKA